MQINLTPDLSLPAIMVIFIINYLIVRKFFLEPVNNVIEARETETRGAEQVYEEALAKFNAATSTMESQLHDAKRAAAAVRDQFRAEANSYRTAAIEKTQNEAKQIVASADEKLTADVATARQQIVRESETLAHVAAERILGRAV